MLCIRKSDRSIYLKNKSYQLVKMRGDKKNKSTTKYGQRLLKKITVKSGWRILERNKANNIVFRDNL